MFPSKVSFLFSIYLILVEYLLQSYKTFCPLLIFHCKKNEYLEFLMHHYLDFFFRAQIPAILDFFEFDFNSEKYEKR